jgi:RNA exonuclease 4
MKISPFDPNTVTYTSFDERKQFSPAPASPVSSVRSSSTTLSQSFSPQNRSPDPCYDSYSSSPSSTSSPPRRYVQRNELVVSDRSKTNHFMASRCVALDCEMVGVGPQGKISVLARVSVVDFYGHSLLDSFVRVEERVTDYRTHISGVKEADLKGPNARDFGAVRKIVKQVLKNKIIVGHGLENDLRALKIEADHPWYNIRDSATQYQPYMRIDQFGQLKPRRLRDVVWYNLGIVIQQEGRPHDSMEDARAAMALYRHQQADWEYEIDCRRRNSFANYAKLAFY